MALLKTMASALSQPLRRLSRLASPAYFHTPLELKLTRQSLRPYSCACRPAFEIKPTKKKAYIALGSNMGDRIAEIEKACNEMDRRNIRVQRTSSLWETKPMYFEDQAHFINGACEVSHCLCLAGVALTTQGRN